MARSGPVRVLGAPGQYDLQIVPTLTAAGPLVPGQLTVLEGTGLLKGDLNLTIDGIAITDFQVKTLRDHDDFHVLPDRQIVTFIVPNGIDAGVIQAVTSGGRVTLQTHVARIAGPLVQPLVDAGDTRLQPCLFQPKLTSVSPCVRCSNRDLSQMAIQTGTGMSSTQAIRWCLM